MEKLTKEDGMSASIVDQNIKALKSIFPSAFTEDGIKFEVLRQLLGDDVAIGDEKYGFVWHGKKRARQIALTPSTGTLRPCPEESVNWENTKNIFIEGDNLEALKILQRSYAGKVKMIYIDPPYNTGSEFIYQDRFQDNLETYLRYTGQKCAEGFKVVSNAESSGRYHTNWLNMMYPRLKLARIFLANDGAIFVSIDESEVHNLRKILDEIFGEENFVNCVSVKMSEASGVKMSHVKKRLPKLKEHLLIYRKSSDFHMNSVTVKGGEWNEEYKEYLDGVTRADLEDLKSLFEEDELDISSVQKANIILSNAKVITAKEAHSKYGNEEDFEKWRWENAWRIIQAVGSSSVKNLALKNSTIAEQDILSVLSPRGKLYIYKREFNKDTKSPRIQVLFADVNIEQKIGDFWPDIRTTGGIGGEGKIVFPNGKKPLKLLRRVLELSTSGTNEEIVMDFFAGSASFGHAVLDANAEDQGARRFILVQIPENIEAEKDLYDFGFKTVSEVSIQRLKNVVESQPEVGFRVFKLDSSNIRAWCPDAKNLEQNLLDYAEHLVVGRSEQDLLYELLLKRGVDLASPIEAKIIEGKTVYSIGYGVLFACLNEAIGRTDIETIATCITEWRIELDPAADTHVVFRDNAFVDDIAKTNMAVILEQNGIAHVRSL